jgi:hypothetical protein
MQRAPWSGLDATFPCPACGLAYRVSISERCEDQPGNRYPALWRRVQLPCSHVLPLEYDAEHQSCGVRAV